MVRTDDIKSENCQKQKNKNKNNTSYHYKEKYHYKDTVETIVDSMKPSIYTDPGVALYQNDIDRCQYDTETNDGIISFGMSWEELLYGTPNIAYIHPQLLQRYHDFQNKLKKECEKATNNHEHDIKCKRLLEMKYINDFNILIETKRPKIWNKKILILPQNVGNWHWNLYIVFNPSHILIDVNRPKGEK